MTTFTGLFFLLSAVAFVVVAIGTSVDLAVFGFICFWLGIGTSWFTKIEDRS